MSSILDQLAEEVTKEHKRLKRLRDNCAALRKQVRTLKRQLERQCVLFDKEEFIADCVEHFRVYYHHEVDSVEETMVFFFKHYKWAKPAEGDKPTP